MKEKLLAAFEVIVEAGAHVEIAYKKEISHWYTEIKLYKLDKEYIISGGNLYNKFDTFKEASDAFYNMCFTSKNIGLIQNRLMKKIELDDGAFAHPSKELKKLFKEEGKILDKENGK